MCGEVFKSSTIQVQFNTKLLVDKILVRMNKITLMPYNHAVLCAR